MRILTEEEFNKQLVSLKDNSEKAKLNVSDELLEKIANAPASITEDTGGAYPGALAVHINLITAIALKLAKMISGTFTIDETSIYKVCFCQHLSKLDMYVKNDNQWEIEKRGMVYKFASLPGRLKFGERSILYSINELKTTFTPEEWEAMECVDRETEDKGKYFDSILTTIVKQANELAYSIEKEKNNKLK